MKALQELNSQNNSHNMTQLINSPGDGPALPKGGHGGLVALDTVLADAGVPLLRLLILKPVLDTGIPDHDAQEVIGH